MAAVDYFLKIDGIEGESQDSKHKNEIDVQSWNWGAFQRHQQHLQRWPGRRQGVDALVLLHHAGQQGFGQADARLRHR